MILASASPRRAELLKAAGIEFTIRTADIDETVLSGESPRDYVIRLSREKARAVARKDQLVLAADTTVVIKDKIEGKPVDAEDARRMLKSLSGHKHEVLTGVTIMRDNLVLSEIAVTEVEFAHMSDSEIDWYISTGEPMDKAGAYGIQGYASRFITRIDGSYSNVVGLPIQTVYKMLSRFSEKI